MLPVGDPRPVPAGGKARRTTGHFRAAGNAQFILRLPLRRSGSSRPTAIQKTLS
jgi:hypothetical protein